MKRIHCCLLVLGLCLFCVSTACAQQDPGFVPVWDDSLNLIDSLIFQTADGRLVIDTSTTPGNPILTLNNSGTGPVLQVSGLAFNGAAVSVAGRAGTGLDVSTAAGLGQAILASCTGPGQIDCYGIFARGKSIGILASATNAGGRAGLFQGDVHVQGTLTKSSGGFKIDHPLEPANKYLSHSFVESPDMMNIYNGIVVLDSKGEAWVNMPYWFEGLNRDFRYQLTAIGAPAPKLYSAKEISGNRFKIAGGKPGGKVSWQVTGVRQDAYANAHRIIVEEDKPREERGYYLHPELFGQPAAKSVSALRTPAPASLHAAVDEREVASHR